MSIVDQHNSRSAGRQIIHGYIFTAVQIVIEEGSIQLLAIVGGFRFEIYLERSWDFETQ